ncbi:MAG TPA: nuclear transport factor 2 family protein [Thermoleophilaceae bacterium]|nr:nuclear transport factor 2 family protein [Thermoleophilaceae bacterium]
MSEAASAAVERAEAAIAAAIPAHDVEALADLLHDELVWTDWAGGSGGKEEDLAAHRANAFTAEVYEVVATSIDVATDDVAVTRTEVAVEGEPVSGRVFYTRAWVRDGDRWRVRVAHLGLVEAEPA